MKLTGRVLVVDDEQSITDAFEIILADHGLQVKAANTVSQAGAEMSRGPFDLVFTDLRLPDSSGLELLTLIKENSPDTEVVLMTAHGSLDVTIEAIKKGAYYYLEKPFTPDQLVMLTERALQFVAIKRENSKLKQTLAAENAAFGIVGRTPKMFQIYETIRATARSEASVLVEGESGTGKELIATAFHMNSGRASGPFVPINCAAIPKELIESELFGYRKGAFTGADRDKRGLIESARGGTLLLDEIGEMPAHLQTKLLRVLQERKLRRLGDEQFIEVDFRLVAATNRDTTRAMQEGVLREDLYFRISTIKIKVPPLRERLDDLPLLAEKFLQRYGEKYGKNIRGLSLPAFSLLTRYAWPGNVRELESVIERAVLFCQGDQIVPENLPEHIQLTESGHFRCAIPPYLTLEEVEREAIEQTLQRTGGNVKKTAQILNLHRPTLYRKLKKFGLKGNIDTDVAE
ncbi:MAG TPA: sigma-54 dependent transcriptional regulator [Blastocatellia bacterium]|jgi:DNA-binding NtrC family response regulator|nr:sigma-54 dependent transcriptional regulator [Blastocatellia bacterium]